jgi:4-hydroxy-tetrahydrodipicolinate synthase
MMATASEARPWARSVLRGIGDSLYTPFCGTDGDDIDWDAYRTLVRYCVSDLGHPMLWCTSGIAEFWSLTLDERKRLLEVAIEEARAANPDIVVQACTAAMSAKDCLDLTLHAQRAGADIAYIQTPMMEAHGGEGVLRFFKYIGQRTDIALGMFNSPSSGYVLTAAEGARIYDEVPAVCATKEGAFRPANSRLLHELAPGLVIWECEKTVYRAGWLRDGIVCPAQLGTAGYLFETPQRPLLSEYWDLVCNDKLIEAMDYGRESGLDQLEIDLGSWFTCYPGRADCFTHWGGAFKYAASVLGLPIGGYPHSRPPQAELPPEAKAQIENAYRRLGLVDASPTARTALTARVGQ